MQTKKLTCIECPIGCAIEVSLQNGEILSVQGNTCPRGKVFAQNEITCPKRVITTTVRCTNGEMLPVKTSNPVNKSETFEIMKKINQVVAKLPVKIGDVLVKNIAEGADLVATDNRD